MSWQTVMVYLVPGAANERVVGFARELASRTEARVIGITAADVSPPVYFMDGGDAQLLLEQMRAEVQVGLSTLRSMFENAMRGSKVKFDWRSDLRRPLEYICEQSRAADILVVPSTRQLFSDPFSVASLDGVLVAAGRPVLTVPVTAAPVDLRHVMVAWKDCREARRAVVDALPLLKLAREVSIVEVPEDRSDSSTAMRGLHDVRHWLERHDVSATPDVLERSNNVPERLRQFVSDAGVTLIVAGAYGHSRLREFVLGGVTDDLLRFGKVPVLLSN